MSRGALSTTSFAVLGLLAVRPWTSYELTQQMERSLGWMWPRAQSKLYEEPKKLVDHGLALARREQVGRRPRTVYEITPEGRQALADWLHEPGEGPVLEFEQLLKVFFADSGTRADTLATLSAMRRWAELHSVQNAAVADQYLQGGGPFPERLALLSLTGRFLTDFCALVGDWAGWATAVVEGWPDRPRDAQADRPALEETGRRAAAAAERAGTA